MLCLCTGKAVDERAHLLTLASQLNPLRRIQEHAALSKLLMMKNDERIVVFRNASIGNSIAAIPAIRAVKEKHPGCFLALIADPVVEQIFRYCPHVDELIVYDKRRKHRSPSKTISFVRELKKKRFDTAVLLKRFFRNEAIAYYADIPRRIGYRTEGIMPFELTDTVPYSEEKHIIELNNDMMSQLGIEVKNNDLEIWFSENEERGTDEFLKSRGIESFAVFHAGWRSGYGDGIGPGMFVEIGHEVVEKYVLDMVVIGGNEEKDVVDEICGKLGKNAYSACGMPLLETACLISRAKAFIGNDGGPSHLADCAGTPGLIVYRDERIMNIWKPLNSNFELIVMKNSEENAARRILDSMGRYLQ
ncbi:MAG: hypothetical protein GF307_02990 [candidate division Zixibacteria bacterium]|nr:hypothetical protein [candidate division Zixibacteria bacterium]